MSINHSRPDPASEDAGTHCLRKMVVKQTEPLESLSLLTMSVKTLFKLKTNVGVEQ